MKKLYQSNLDSITGNCFRTAIASLFEVDADAVPDFKKIELSGDDWFKPYCDFIRDQGYRFLGTIYNPNRPGTRSNRMDEFKTRYAGVDGVFEALVYSPKYYDPKDETPITHSVLVDCDMNIVHDPNPNNQELEFYPEADRLGHNGVLSVAIIERCTRLTVEARNELRKLTPEQRALVLKGLDVKLGHFEKTGKLSYRYDICSICADVGSTEDDPHCDECYIEISCKAPFERGFEEDMDKGYEYFGEMRDFLRNL